MSSYDTLIALMLLGVSIVAICALAIVRPSFPDDEEMTS